MGYTHYFHHRRRFTNAQWEDVKRDVLAILTAAQLDGLAFGDGFGERPLRALKNAFTDFDGTGGPALWINGVGDESHETFAIYQNRRPLDSWQKPSRRGWDFCKTARKPYDVAVTAILIYLESLHPDKFSASSDGESDDWQAGLDLARAALPKVAEFLQIPVSVEFDSLVKRYYFNGSKHTLCEMKTGEFVLIDDESLTPVYEFTPEGVEWVKEYVDRAAQERRAMLPARCDTLDRWQARKMRRLIEAAPVMGYAKAI